MSEEPTRPWWSSDAGTDSLADDHDPVTTHRRARRPPGPGQPEPQRVEHDPRGADHDPRGADHAPSGDGRSRGEGEPVDDPEGAGGGTDDDARRTDHEAMTCGVCPICVGLRALGEHRPDVLEHLREASLHLAAVVRCLLEPPQSPPSRTPRGSGPDEPFERIDVDGPEAAEPVDDEESGRWAP